MSWLNDVDEEAAARRQKTQSVAIPFQEIYEEFDPQVRPLLKDLGDLLFGKSSFFGGSKYAINGDPSFRYWTLDNKLPRYTTFPDQFASMGLVVRLTIFDKDALDITVSDAYRDRNDVIQNAPARKFHFSMRLPLSVESIQTALRELAISESNRKHPFG